MQVKEIMYITNPYRDEDMRVHTPSKSGQEKRRAKRKAQRNKKKF